MAQDITINIIGCGKLGKTIGYLLANQAGCKIKGILNKTFASSQRSAQFIGSGTACKNIQELESAHIWLVATPDDTIPVIGQQLLTSNKLAPGTIIIHFSGILNSVLFKPLYSKGCFYASLHPLMVFSNPSMSVNSFRDTYCCYEGDEEPFAMIETLFTKMGARILKLNCDKKAILYMASKFSSDCISTILKSLQNLLKNSEIEEHAMLAIIQSFLTKSINNISLSPIESAYDNLIDDCVSDLLNFKNNKKIKIARN